MTEAKEWRIALAGNPNTGKSTLFNTLTGLRQHTGNWPGKTVVHAEGYFVYNNRTYRIIDLPGTYSLLSNSADEEVARDFIIFEKPDVTVVVLDATALERNLNFALQVLEMTDQVIACINLMDEARKKGIKINKSLLAKKLGVPVLTISARNGEGIDELMKTIELMVDGKIKTNPLKVQYSPDIEEKIAQLIPMVTKIFGNEYPARWVALRLIDGDRALLDRLWKDSPSSLRRMTDHGYSCGC